MSTVLLQAQEHTRDSRHFNRERLARKATATEITVGDTVIVAANEPVSLSAKWDHQFEVTKIRGLTYWVRHQLTNKELKVHRDKLRIVDPNMAWDNVAARPRRQQARRAPVLEPPLCLDPDLIEVHAPAGPRIRPAVPPPNTGTCRADIHVAPAPVMLNQAHEQRDNYEQRAASPNPSQPPACSGLPDTLPPLAEVMETEPPAYQLRKRNAVGWVINPSDAKRSRIACLTFTRDWYTAHIPDTSYQLSHSTPADSHVSPHTPDRTQDYSRTPHTRASQPGAAPQPTQAP